MRIRENIGGCGNTASAWSVEEKNIHCRSRCMSHHGRLQEPGYQHNLLMQEIVGRDLLSGGSPSSDGTFTYAW